MELQEKEFECREESPAQFPAGAAAFDAANLPLLPQRLRMSYRASHIDRFHCFCAELKIATGYWDEHSP